MPGGGSAAKQKTSDKFVEGEKILCYHGPLLYEAKINKLQVKDKITQFHVHYSGWSKSWDEWVAEGRMLKINDANLQKQKELQQQNPLAEKQRKTTSKRKTDRRRDIEPLSRRRRVRQDEMMRDPSPSMRPELKIDYSEEIKKSLVDDWDLVTRQKQLVRLPRQITVQNILDKYKENVVSSDPDKNSCGQISELCEGLKDYFDIMLGTQLLYKFERPQYSDVLQMYPDKSPSEVYGIEHFLRLFVRLGSMLSYTTIEEDNLIMLQNHVQDFLRYITSSLDSFPMEYDPAPADYLRRLT
jgi:mortality factor 4-like protein 1